MNYFGKGAGIAVRKQDKDLRTALDNGIKTLRKNGEWQKISDSTSLAPTSGVIN